MKFIVLLFISTAALADPVDVQGQYNDWQQRQIMQEQLETQRDIERDLRDQQFELERQERDRYYDRQFQEYKERVDDWTSEPRE